MQSEAKKVAGGLQSAVGRGKYEEEDEPGMKAVEAVKWRLSMCMCLSSHGSFCAGIIRLIVIFVAHVAHQTHH